MLDRDMAGEQEPWSGLRRRIVTICDMEHFSAQVKWLKDFAKKQGVSDGHVLSIWEQDGCRDVTTTEGRRAFRNAYQDAMDVNLN